MEACLALDQASLGGLWTREQWQQELSQSDRLCVGLLIEQRLIAVACGWLVVDELQIGALAVAPNQRRKGHGRQVLMALLQEALRREVRDELRHRLEPQVELLRQLLPADRLAARRRSRRPTPPRRPPKTQHA